MDEFHRQAIDNLRAEADRAGEREKWMLGTILAGAECQILGKRARVHVEWLDGLPGGMTEDAVRRMGEKMMPDAQPSDT